MGQVGLRRTINETRESVFSEEILVAWGELYIQGGPPTLKDLTSWLGATDGAMQRAWPADLVIGADGVINHKSDEEVYDEEERQRDYMDDMDDVESRRMGEGVQEFDKYMDQILIKEGHGRPAVKPEDNPQRRRAALRQDRPANKIRYGVK